MPRTNQIRAKIWKFTTSKSKIKNLLVNLLILLLTLCFILFILEISFRLGNICETAPEKSGNLFTFTQESSNKDIAYELKPNSRGYLVGKYVSINSAGMRSKEVSPDKPGSVYRIAFIGDSITFGWGVNVEDSFPEVLAELLSKEQNKTIEILNFAAPGYVSIQKITTIKEKILKYNPDLFIIGNFLNDPDKIWNFYQTSAKIPTPIKIFLKENSCTYNWAQDRWKAFLSKSSMTQYTPYKELYAENSTAWQEYKERIRQISVISEQNGIPIIVVLLPNWHNLNESYEFIEINSLLNRTIAESNLYVVDIFSDVYGINAEEYSLEHVHPNERGHKLIADSIYKRIISSNLLL